MMFTKPFKNQNWYVELLDNSDAQTFDVQGINSFGLSFEHSYDILDSAIACFYLELCYMLNTEVMLKTLDQRNECTADLYRKHLVSNLVIDK